MGVIEIVQQYNNLLNVEYEVVVGRKGHSFTMSICFDDEMWAHTLGLHHLDDLFTTGYLNNTKNTKELYKILVNGGDSKYSNIFFESSTHYNDDFVRRMNAFGQQEYILDTLNDKGYLTVTKKLEQLGS